MTGDKKESCKNPPIGKPKGVAETEFSKCCGDVVVPAIVKGEKFKYCRGCSKKIEENKGEKNENKRSRRS